MGNVTTGGSTTTPNSPQVTKTSDMLLKGLQSAYKGGVDVFDKPLYKAPSATTQSAWGQGTGFANGLIGSGGYGSGQRAAQDSLGGVFSGYGGVADNNGLTDAQSGAMAGLGGLGGQYAGLGGLNAGQQSAMSRTAGLGDAYGGLATAYDPNSSAYQTLRSGISDSVLADVVSLGASNGRYGSESFNKGAAEGLGQALAGLDYSNMQNNINNQYRSLDSQKGIYDTLFGQNQQGTENTRAALDAQRGIYGDTFNMGQTGVGNTLAGLGGQAATAGAQFGMGQQALGNEQGAIGLLGSIGGSQDADNLARRMANADLFDRTHNADWNTLARATSILGGNSQASGSTTSNTVPWYLALLGSAATGASIFG